MSPQPHKTITCQQVLKDGHCTHSGWIRKRSALHKFSAINKIVPWMNKYVVLSQGCVYVYGSDTSSKPKHPFSLHGYDKVLQAGEILQRDVPWPFKLVPVPSTTSTTSPKQLKPRYFAAGSEREQRVWMVEFKKQMMFANGKGFKVSHNYSGDSETASLTIVQESVYTDASDYTPDNRNHGNADSEEEGEEYNEIEEWQMGNGNHQHQHQESKKSTRGPLPLPPGQDKAGKTLNRTESSQSDDFASRPPPPLPSPISSIKSSHSFNQSFNQSKSPPSPLQSPTTSTPPVPTPRSRQPPLLPTDLPQDSPPPTPDSSVKPVDGASGGIKSRIAALNFNNSKPAVANKPSWAPVNAVKLLPTPSDTRPVSGTTQLHSNATKRRDQKLPSPPSDRRPPPIPPTYSEEKAVAPANMTEEEFINSIHLPGITREQAAQYVSETGEEGVYLLRDGSGGDNDYVLAVFAEGYPRKYKVSKEGRQVYLEKDRKFASIRVLIQYYHDNSIPLRMGTQLTRPYNIS